MDNNKKELIQILQDQKEKELRAGVEGDDSLTNLENILKLDDLIDSIRDQ